MSLGLIRGQVNLDLKCIESRPGFAYQTLTIEMVFDSLTLPSSVQMEENVLNAILHNFKTEFRFYTFSFNQSNMEQEN